MTTSLLLTILTSVSSGNPAGYLQPQSTNANDGFGFELIKRINPIKVLESDCGYAYVEMDLYKSPYTDKSNLYLLNSKVNFTPGIIPQIHGDRQDDGSKFKEAYLKYGGFDFELEQYNEGWRRSGNISIKASWPYSTNVSTTISSSFSKTLSFGISNGQSTGNLNGGFLSVEANSMFTTSVAYQFTKTLSSVTADPMLSHQYSPQSVENLEWTYITQNPEVAGTITYNVNSYVLFEMDNTAMNMSSDAFRCRVNTFYQNTEWNHDDDKPGDLFERQEDNLTTIGFFY